MRVPLTALLLCTGLAAAATNLAITLTPSNYNGYNISCFGVADGSIDLTVTGGTPPYTYSWSTAETTQDIANIPAGYYLVKVSDADATEKSAAITLTEPEDLQSYSTIYEYPNGYNISCYDCYNGSVDVTTGGGVGPYTYLWADGNTQGDRTGLGSDSYSLWVTDANGCETKGEGFYLKQPERTDWTMNGNAGTNPATQFMGTSDNQDVVFKTNAEERLRILSSGNLRTPSMSFAQGYKLVMVDSLGTLKSFDESEIQPGRLGNCPQYSTIPWTLCGNYIDGDQFMGTTNSSPLRFRTDNTQRMVITSWGKVGIGTTPPVGAVDQYRLYVEEGIVTRDVLVKVGTWPDYVFDPRYELMPFDELRTFLATNNHLPGIPSAADVEAKQGVEVGDLQAKMLKVIEEQALYILELEERFSGMEQRMKVLEASK
ncbi:MAG: SprB repeat-containing protein [Flavobacteriales bacterium]